MDDDGLDPVRDPALDLPCDNTTVAAVLDPDWKVPPPTPGEYKIAVLGRIVWIIVL